MKAQKLGFFILSICLVATGVAAQGQANDVNAPAANGTPLPPVTAGGGLCPPAGTVSGAFTGATSQSGRIFRDGIPSACPSKVYPGIFNVGTIYNYETFTYPNTSGATSCVTINFDPNAGGSPCGTNAHMSAYIGSYDPNNQGANFVGDVGSSVTQPFSFDVPAGSQMVLAVTNTASQAICDFAFQVVNLPCSEEADLAITKTVSPESVAPGDNAVFTISVTNNGPGGASNTVVTDSLPAGLSYVSNDCGASFADPTVTWTIGTLANGATTVCNVTVTVDDAGSFANSATVSSDQTDPVTSDNTSTASVTGQLAAVTVPTLSGTGVVVLLLALGLTAIWVLRRRA